MTKDYMRRTVTLRNGGQVSYLIKKVTKKLPLQFYVNENPRSDTIGDLKVARALVEITGHSPEAAARIVTTIKASAGSMTPEAKSAFEQQLLAELRGDEQP